MWSTGEGNGKPLQYACLENPMNTMKRHFSITFFNSFSIFNLFLKQVSVRLKGSASLFVFQGNTFNQECFLRSFILFTFFPLCEFRRSSCLLWSWRAVHVASSLCSLCGFDGLGAGLFLVWMPVAFSLARAGGSPLDRWCADAAAGALFWGSQWQQAARAPLHHVMGAEASGLEFGRAAEGARMTTPGVGEGACGL